MSDLKVSYNDTSKASFIVPSDEVSRQKCLAVEEIASDWLKKNCSIYYKRDYAINTIASVYLEEMFGLLSVFTKRDRYAIDGQCLTLNGIIDAIATMKHDDESEKEGNINLKIRLGGRYYYPEDMTKDLREYPYDEKKTFKIVLPSGREFTSEIDDMKLNDNLAQRKLQRKFHIIIVQPLMASTITSAFLTAVIQWCVDTCQDTKKPILYNISDIIECRCVLKDGEPMVSFVPGVGAKLAIKFDEFTEEEE